MCPGVQVHHGFYDQLRDVTSRAASTSSNITYMLQQMMGNETPIRVRPVLFCLCVIFCLFITTGKSVQDPVPVIPAFCR